jgi:hypothetical protein
LGQGGEAAWQCEMTDCGEFGHVRYRHWVGRSSCSGAFRQFGEASPSFGSLHESEEADHRRQVRFGGRTGLRMRGGLRQKTVQRPGGIPSGREIWIQREGTISQHNACFRVIGNGSTSDQLSSSSSASASLRSGVSKPSLNQP